MKQEEFAEIMMYGKEHKVTYKSRFAELNISVWRFYGSKSRYAKEQPPGNTSKGDFIRMLTIQRIGTLLNHPGLQSCLTLTTACIILIIAHATNKLMCSQVSYTQRL